MFPMGVTHWLDSLPQKKKRIGNSRLERVAYIDPTNNALADDAGDIGDRVQSRHQDPVLLGAESNVVHGLEQIRPTMAALESLSTYITLMSAWFIVGVVEKLMVRVAILDTLEMMSSLRARWAWHSEQV